MMFNVTDMPHAPWGREPEQEAGFDDKIENEWFNSIAASIDPSRGVLYDATIEEIKRYAGLSAHDDEDEYTYCGLPAEGGSSDIFREFD